MTKNPIDSRISDLTEQLGNDAKQISSQIGTLTVALRGNDPLLLRMRAIEALEEMGTNARGATRSLTQALQNQDADVRWMVVKALEAIRPEAAEVAEALGSALRDKDPGVRVRAAAALLVVNPKSAQVMAALHRAFQAKDDELRVRAAAALVAGAPIPDAAVALALLQVGSANGMYLTQVARDAGTTPLSQLTGSRYDMSLAEVARHALWHARRKVRRIAVHALCKHDDPHVRCMAAHVLGWCDSKHADDVVSLQKAGLQDESPEVRWAATLALLRGCHDRAAEVEIISRALQNNDPWVRQKALSHMVEALGIDCPEVASALERALKDQDRGVRWEAVLALVRRVSHFPEAASILSLALKDENPDIRWAATDALVWNCPDELAAVRLLVQTLQDKEAKVRCQAANALHRMAHADPALASALARAMREQQEPARRAAIDALNSIPVDPPLFHRRRPRDSAFKTSQAFKPWKKETAKILGLPSPRPDMVVQEPPGLVRFLGKIPGQLHEALMALALIGDICEREKTVEFTQKTIALKMKKSPPAISKYLDVLEKTFFHYFTESCRLPHERLFERAKANHPVVTSRGKMAYKEAMAYRDWFLGKANGRPNT